MATGLPIGTSSWHLRWVYADQIATLPVPEPRTTAAAAGQAVIGSTQQLQSSSSQSSSSSATTGDSSLQQQPQQQKPLMSCAGIPVEENLKIAKSYFTTDIAAGRDPAVPFRYVEPSDRLMSTYTDTYRAPDPNWKWSPLVSAKRGRFLNASNSTFGGSRQTMTGLSGSGRPHVKPAPATFLHHHLDAYYHMNKEQGFAKTPDDVSFRLWSRINPGYFHDQARSETQENLVDHGANAEKPDRTYAIKIEDNEYKEAMARQNRIDRERVRGDLKGVRAGMATRSAGAGGGKTK